MGIGSNGIGRVFCVALAVAVLPFAPAAARELTTGIWKVMRDGGFDASFDDDEDTIRLIGDMDVGKWHYRFMNYEYLESKQHMAPGGVQHGGSMLVVFDRTKKGLVYLGRYETWGGHPKIKGHTLVFPYRDLAILGDKPAKTVTFDENGPPSQIFLDGMVFPFQKGIEGRDAGK